MTNDFFRKRLDQLIDLRHLMEVLTNRMPWQDIRALLVYRLARQLRVGLKIEDLGMFVATQIIAGASVYNACLTRFPTPQTASYCRRLASN